VDTRNRTGLSSFIAVGSDGFPIISYWDETNDDLIVTHCSSISCVTYDNPTSMNVKGIDTSIAIGRDKFPIISFHDRDLSSENLTIIHCLDQSCLLHETKILVAGYKTGVQNSMAIGVDGYPIISYRDYWFSTLRILHCTSEDCDTHEPVVTPDNLFNTGLHTSIAIGSDSYPIVSYYRLPSLKVLHCTSINCISHDVPLTLGPMDNFSPTSIARGFDSLPIIAYGKDGNITVVHCSSVNCMTFDDPISLVIGSSPSLAIGDDNYPIIAYWDEINDDLKVVHCISFDCSLFDLPFLLDEVGIVGLSPSITIGVDSAPIISYLGNGYLKVVHCHPPPPSPPPPVTIPTAVVTIPAAVPSVAPPSCQQCELFTH